MKDLQVTDRSAYGLPGDNGEECDAEMPLGVQQEPNEDCGLCVFARGDGESALWAKIDGIHNGKLRLESCTDNMRTFEFWKELPQCCRRLRNMTLGEAYRYGHCLGMYETLLNR